MVPEPVTLIAIPKLQTGCVPLKARYPVCPASGTVESDRQSAPLCPEAAFPAPTPPENPCRETVIKPAATLRSTGEDTGNLSDLPLLRRPSSRCRPLPLPPVIRSQVEGSSTVLPYAAIIAETLGENFDFQPVAADVRIHHRQPHPDRRRVRGQHNFV